MKLERSSIFFSVKMGYLFQFFAFVALSRLLAQPPITLLYYILPTMQHGYNLARILYSITTNKEWGKALRV